MTDDTDELVQMFNAFLDKTVAAIGRLDASQANTNDLIGQMFEGMTRLVDEFTALREDTQQVPQLIELVATLTNEVGRLADEAHRAIDELQWREGVQVREEPR